MLRHPGKDTRSGFTYLELVVVIAMIGVLLAVALPRLLPYVHEAERVAVRTVESNLNDALVLRAARHLARGETSRIMEMGGTNPMALMLEPPGNYLGELDTPLLSDMPPRSWFFDRRSRALFYRGGPGLADPGRADMPPYQAWIVEVAWNDVDEDGRFSLAADELYGVRLVKVAGAGHFRPGQSGR